MRAAQPVQREHAEAGRAIHEHEVVVLGHRSQCPLKSLVSPVQIDKFHFGTGQFTVGADDVVARLLSALTRFSDGGAFEQHVVHGHTESALVHTRTHRRVSLRVEVHHQDALPHPTQAGREVDGGGGLADPTLLVRNAKNSGHRGFHADQGRSNRMPKPIRKTPAIRSSQRLSVRCDLTFSPTSLASAHSVKQ